MKYIIMYLSIIYIIFCADDIGEPLDSHTGFQRIGRAIAWPVTLTSWFRSQSIRLHRLLTILWCILILGWLLSLLADRLP